jgi:UrcA family protein
MTSTGPSLHHRPVRPLILASLAAASLSFLATPGKAAAPSPGEEPIAITVPFGDLNLSSQDGLGQLYQRIVAAAKQACGGGTDTRPLANWSQSRMCTRASIARAVAAVGVPDLLALYARKNGHPIDSKVLLSKR